MKVRGLGGYRGVKMKSLQESENKKTNVKSFQKLPPTPLPP